MCTGEGCEGGRDDNDDCDDDNDDDDDCDDGDYVNDDDDDYGPLPGRCAVMMMDRSQRRGKSKVDLNILLLVIEFVKTSKWPIFNLTNLVASSTHLTLLFLSSPLQSWTPNSQLDPQPLFRILVSAHSCLF